MRRLAFAAALFAAGCAAPPADPAPKPTPLEELPVRERGLDDAIRDGVAFLLKSQRPSGAFATGLGAKGWESYEAAPGSPEAFKVGATGLACEALREVGTPEALVAARRGELWLATKAVTLRRASAGEIYNCWGYIYALQALSFAIERETDPERLAILKKGAQEHLDLLHHYQTAYGGWNYYDFVVGARVPSMAPTSFTTAAGLVAFAEAKEAGLAVPEHMVKSCLRVVERCRTPMDVFTYNYDDWFAPRARFNVPQGAMGRSQACYEALLSWNSPTVDLAKATKTFDYFVKEHRFIECGRKRQFPHEAWYATAPYYYYFGHYYASRILTRFPDEKRREAAKTMLTYVLPHQEEDGSWWDYPMLDVHKPYGTSFAIMILLRCRDSLK